MAELQADERRILNTVTPMPDLSQGNRAISESLGQVANVAGNLFIKEKTRQDQLEADLMLNDANNQISTVYNAAKENPNLTTDSLFETNQTATLLANQAIGLAPRSHQRSLQNKLAMVQQNQDAALGQVFAGQKRDAGIKIINDGVVETARNQLNPETALTPEEYEETLSNYKNGLSGLGVSDEDINGMLFAVDVGLNVEQIRRALQAGRSQDQLDNIMQSLFYEENTPLSDAVIKEIWPLYTKMSSFFKEGVSLQENLFNIYAGQSYRNRDMSTKASNELVELTAKFVALADSEGIQFDSRNPYNALVTEGSTPEQALEQIGNAIGNALNNPPNNEVTLEHLVTAQAAVGSPNATVVTQKIEQAFAAGNGDAVNQAAAFLRMIDSDPNTRNSFEINPTTAIMYTDYDAMWGTGRRDFDQMLSEVKASSAKAIKNINFNTEKFNTTYSMTNKDFERVAKEIHGSGSVSSEAMFNTYRLFKNAYLASDGRSEIAVMDLKRSMSRTYGTSAFSASRNDENEVVVFPLEKTLEGQSLVTQSNQVAYALAQIAPDNPTLSINFGDILNASDEQKAYKNFAALAVDTTQFTNITGIDTYKASQILQNDLSKPMATQTLPDGQKITGRVILRNIGYTDQNNKGNAVYSLSIQDDNTGKIFPIYDKNSPYNQQALMQAQSLNLFAPEAAKKIEEEQIQETSNNSLAAQARKLYPWLSMNPGTMLANYNNRKIYQENFEEQKRTRNQVKEALTGKKNQPQEDSEAS